MTHLRTLDQIAYVRFASVYRSFRDIDEFRLELDNLARDGAKAAPEGADPGQPASATQTVEALENRGKDKGE